MTQKGVEGGCEKRACNDEEKYGVPAMPIEVVNNDTDDDHDVLCTECYDDDDESHFGSSIGESPTLDGLLHQDPGWFRQCKGTQWL